MVDLEDRTKIAVDQYKAHLEELKERDAVDAGYDDEFIVMYVTRFGKGTGIEAGIKDGLIEAYKERHGFEQEFVVDRLVHITNDFYFALKNIAESSYKNLRGDGDNAEGAFGNAMSDIVSLMMALKDDNLTKNKAFEAFKEYVKEYRTHLVIKVD